MLHFNYQHLGTFHVLTAGGGAADGAADAIG